MENFARNADDDRDLSGDSTGHDRDFDHNAFIMRPDERLALPGRMDRTQLAELLARKTLSPGIIGGIFALLETAFLLTAGLFCFIFFNQVISGEIALPIMVMLSLMLLFAVFAQGLHVYEMRVFRDPAQQFMRTFAIWLTCFGCLVLTSLLFPQYNIFQTDWVSPWFVAGLFVILALRLPMSMIVRQWTDAGLLERRAVIVGGGKEAEDVIVNLERQENNDIRICGIFDDRTDDRSPESVAGYPKLGTVTELIEFARDTKLDMLLVSLPLTADGRVREMLKKLWVLPLDIRLSAHTNKLAFKARNFSYIGAMPFIKLADKPIAGWGFVRKRIFDAIMSAFLLVVLFPFLVATAIAIKLDSKGPVFFRQKRHGFNNEEIDVWKFRSMYTDMCDAQAKVVVTKNDPRVTRVGAFIRKTSIDELPQLWNVLRGELSLVGPRPHAVHAHLKDTHWNDVVDGYFARHRVKPGVTGWAQINGWRGEVTTQKDIKKRTDYDLYYIENWSLRFDLYILCLTPFRLMNTENAY